MYIVCAVPSISAVFFFGKEDTTHLGWGSVLLLASPVAVCQWQCPGPGVRKERRPEAFRGD